MKKSKNVMLSGLNVQSCHHTSTKFDHNKIVKISKENAFKLHAENNLQPNNNSNSNGKITL